MRRVISESIMTTRGTRSGVVLIVCVLITVLSFTLRHAGPTFSTPDWAAVLNIGVLVFREGLECVLVLAAIAAGAAQTRQPYQGAIAIGAATGFGATLLTWMIAVRVLSDLSENISALALQAASGFLAVLVLLVVMNWFFHKVYWTGWISAHSQRKRKLLEEAKNKRISPFGVFWGMALLGFTSVYREGFEVVLFLQSYRLKLGGPTVLRGVVIGLFLSATVAVLTFLAHRRLPYRRMLVLTGILLGIVLIVMVGEQAQEMQFAHWISITRISWLSSVIPAWMGLWFSVFPTIETLLAQFVAAALVLGSYFFATRETGASATPQSAEGPESEEIKARSTDPT
jgi:high-affinity iron transporter